jgi:dienelactone hydrolase
MTTPLLWGDSEPGPYPVGFATSYELDHGLIYPDHDPAKHPRPLLVAVWYPAAAGTGCGPMTYGGYFELESNDKLLREFSQRLGEYSLQTACLETVGRRLGDLDTQARSALEALLATPTSAMRDAGPAAGRFPLLVYHPGLGGSYEENAVLFEILASHGYVVVSSAYQSPQGVYLEIDGNIESSLSDMERLIGLMSQREFVDRMRIGVMGHSYGAGAALEMFSRSRLVDLVISFDSTCDYDICHPGWRAQASRLAASRRSMTAPMLLFATPSAEFTLFRSLVYAERRMVRIDGLKHNEFLSHGVARRRLAGDNGSEAARAVVEGYERLCAITLAFVDQHFTADPDGRSRVDQLAAGAHSYEHLPGLPAPPNELEFDRLVELEGAAAAIESLRDSIEPGILRNHYLYHAGHRLLRAGRAEDAIRLFELWTTLEPESADAFEFLGRAYMKLGYRDKGITALTRTIDIHTANPDLDDRSRTEAISDAQAMLQSLLSSPEPPIPGRQ